MKYIKYAIIVFTVILINSVNCFAQIQTKLVFNPSKPICEFVNEYEEVLCQYKQKTDGGNEIALWATEGDPQKPVIILSHGRSAYARTLLPLIKTLREDNNIVILYSYSGYPPSSGKPSENNTYDDLAAVINFAKTQFNINSNNIILAGHSLGSAVAIDAASKDNYKAIFAMVPFSSIKDVQKHQAIQKPILKIFNAMRIKHKFDSASKVDKVQSPLYLFYSEEDEITPHYMAEKLIEKNEDIIGFLYQHGDHNDTSWFAEDLADLIKKINLLE